MRYIFGDNTLDTERYELRRTGERIPIRPKIFQLLVYLLTHRDRVVLKEELLASLWPNQFIGDTALKSCIMLARKAVGDCQHPQRMIQTFHGRGYRFVAAVTEASESPPEGPTRSLLVPSRESAEGIAASLNAAHAVSAPEELGHAVAHAPVTGREAHAGAEGRDTFPDVLEGERKQVTIL